MSDNFLSQDEIDKLLNTLGDDGEFGENGGGGGGDDGGERYKVLTPIFELFCKHASSALSTGVAKTVDLTPESCAKADFAAAMEKVGSDVLSVTLPVTSGVEGDMYLIMPKKSAAALSNLMLGIESDEYNPAESDDAISEQFNQVMGAFCTALGAELGEQTSAGSVQVSPFDMASPPFDGDSADMGMVKVSVEGAFDFGMALLIPNSFGDEIIVAKAPQAPSSSFEGIGINQSEMDELMSMASSPSFGGGGGGSSFGVPPPGMSAAPPPPRTGGYDGPRENIDLLLDVELDINIELGKSELTIKRILELAPGSIVELDKMAGEPVDLIVNNKVVARGEVVVVDENFGIRIVSLVSAEDRIKSLK